MGTSAGPSLQGIGRGGDSNLVLEMDAHDAKSYPGEPTTNTLLNGYFPGTDTTTVTAGWTLHGTAAITTYRPAAEEFFYKNLGLSNPRVFQINGGGRHDDSGSGYTRIAMPNPTPGFSISTATTVSFWYRFTGQNAAQLSNQKIWVDLDYGLADVYANYTDYNDTEWHLFSATQTSSGSYAYYNLYIYAPLYSACPGGSYFEIGAFQIEQKGYATPFVGDGQFARPATTNLMIHGDVGTGSSFEDSSPSKHTITTNGNTTHSAAQSKFSGGSIYFDGTGDSLQATSADFAVGNGEFTIDCWLYKTATVSHETLFDTYSAGGSNGFICGLWDSTSTMAFYSENGIGWITNTGGTAVALNTWTHLAWVRDGNTLRMFLNGVQQQAYTFGADNLDSSSLIIGGRSSAQYITGYMDEMRITKGTALWTSAFTPPTRRNLSAPVVDRSGNHNGINLINGTDSGGATYRAGEVIEPVATAVLDFDGTDDYAIAGDSDDWNFGTEPFAIEQWLNFGDATPSGDAWSCALQQYAAEGDRNGWLLFYNNGSSGLEWRLECTAPTPSFYPAHVSLSDLSLNTWHLFTITREGSNFKMYIDGVLRLTDTSNPTFDNIAGPMYIGNYSASDPHEFQGKMGALRIYKGGALSDEQVKENFNQQSSRFNVLNWANNAIVQNGLDLWLDAGDRGSYPGTGSTWYDLTSNNYNGTIANAVYNGGYGNGSFTFDGSGDTVDVGPISTAGDHSNCTISIWMNKAAQVANYGNVYDCNYGATTYNKGPRMEVDIAGSVVRVYMGSDAGNYVSISFGGLSNDVWYNLVLTVTPNGSSQDLKTYTDGALVTSSTSSSTYVWDGDVADLYLGVGYTAGRHFTGKIAAFTLYNRVLSASEIEQNFIVQKQRFGK